MSNRVILITLPVLLNAFLWLGPRLSVGKWYGALLTNSITMLKGNGLSAKDLVLYTDNAPIIVDFFQKLNWLGWIRTFPIGVPALLLNIPNKLPVSTPLGIQNVIQLPSFVIIAGSVMLLSLIGWLGGGVYFWIVAGASLGEDEAGIGVIRAITQTVLLSMIWVVGSAIILLPFLLVMTVLAAINAVLVQIVSFIILFFMFWLVVPLFFTPHGIFVRKQNAFVSIMSSLRMSRFTLPTSSMFVVSVFLLSRGLSFLWTIPTSDSWLLLVGILGHAFISTTLLASSFVYYRDMSNWLQNVYERFQQISNKPLIKKA
ncbi:MAG: hypothetical protein ABI986_01150 [Chloroflexota bacterium]